MWTHRYLYRNRLLSDSVAYTLSSRPPSNHSCHTPRLGLCNALWFRCQFCEPDRQAGRRFPVALARNPLMRFNWNFRFSLVWKIKIIFSQTVSTASHRIAHQPTWRPTRWAWPGQFTPSSLQVLSRKLLCMQHHHVVARSRRDLSRWCCPNNIKCTTHTINYAILVDSEAHCLIKLHNKFNLIERLLQILAYFSCLMWP